LAALPDSLVGAGQADALLAWRDAALRGGAEVRHCTRCGAPVELRDLYGRTRPQCPACGLVQFREPKTTSGVLITEAGRILLARRGMSPGKGLWYLPSGYVDWDERVDEAAIREMAEETGLAVEVTGLFGVFPFGDSQAGYGTLVLYRGRVVGGRLAPGDDVTEAAYFAPDALPELAFETSRQAVAQWVSEQT
jgi:ADP-ribose pyrophosphatase YjhB (NUDIX family)